MPTPACKSKPITFDMEPHFFFLLFSIPHDLDICLHYSSDGFMSYSHQQLTWLCVQHDMSRLRVFSTAHFSTTVISHRLSVGIPVVRSNWLADPFTIWRLDATTLSSTTGRNTMPQIGHNKYTVHNMQLAHSWSGLRPDNEPGQRCTPLRQWPLSQKKYKNTVLVPLNTSGPPIAPVSISLWQ